MKPRLGHSHDRGQFPLGSREAGGQIRNPLQQNVPMRPSARNMISRSSPIAAEFESSPVLGRKLSTRFRRCFILFQATIGKLPRMWIVTVQHR